jgi:ArsR family transcriptional regulator, arsenate/arsenite/antimonite-responsive transcriptional repressor
MVTPYGARYPVCMADLFDVLADSTRRELLATLLAARVAGAPQGELSVSELVDQLGLSQPTVSKHLQKLREYGLVGIRTDGQHHYYHLETAPLRAIQEWVADFIDEGASEVTASSTAYGAWSGAEVGETLGRRIADGTYQARVVVTEKVVPKLPRLRRSKDGVGDVDNE